MMTHILWEEGLEPEDQVKVKWTSGGRYYSAIGSIVRVNKSSISIELLEGVEGFPTGRKISVPNTNPLGSGMKTWSTNNGVFPINGYPVDLFVEGEQHLVLQYGERTNPRGKEEMSLEQWIRAGWDQSYDEEDDLDSELQKEAARNPSAISCPSCGIGNRQGRSICWKCGFELEIRDKPYFGGWKQRPALYKFRRNP